MKELHRDNHEQYLHSTVRPELVGITKFFNRNLKYCLIIFTLYSLEELK